MKNKFRIIESDKFYVQEKKLLWVYHRDKEFLEGLQMFFGISAMIVALGILICLITVLILYLNNHPELHQSIVITYWFVGTEILMLMGFFITRNYKKKDFNHMSQAESYVNSVISNREALKVNKEINKLRKKNKRKKQKNKKIHYLDIKIERAEKLKKIQNEA